MKDSTCTTRSSLVFAIVLEACLVMFFPAACEAEGTHLYELYHPDGVMGHK